MAPRMCMWRTICATRPSGTPSTSRTASRPATYSSGTLSSAPTQGGPSARISDEGAGRGATSSSARPASGSPTRTTASLAIMSSALAPAIGSLSRSRPCTASGMAPPRSAPAGCILRTTRAASAGSIGGVTRIRLGRRSASSVATRSAVPSAAFSLTAGSSAPTIRSSRGTCPAAQCRAWAMGVRPAQGRSRARLRGHPWPSIAPCPGRSASTRPSATTSTASTQRTS
mmetsp:Transcript_4144/g.12467  ORF Transcript_4144/g.12467 Transcript_4144/m.12467 type:complete len:228 (+) Transcript_4144:1112-1795(+)